MSVLSPSEMAVEQVLRAILDDGRKAYLLGAGTQTFSLLTAAHCARTGEDLETFRNEFWRRCRPERVVREEQIGGQS